MGVLEEQKEVNEETIIIPNAQPTDIPAASSKRTKTKELNGKTGLDLLQFGSEDQTNVPSISSPLSSSSSSSSSSKKPMIQVIAEVNEPENDNKRQSEKLTQTRTE